MNSLQIDETKVLVGADPEYFVEKNGTIVSAIGLIGGSKEKPLPVSCGALQEDNVLAEVNIHPCSTTEDWLFNLKSVEQDLLERLGGGFKIKVKSSHLFAPEILCEKPEALVFGCDPDYNCYTGELNPSPDACTALRTAGGHVHIGYEGVSIKRSVKLCKALDVVLGIPSVILDRDNERRKMYGKAGAFRPKPYGVEYRTLSNFWLQSDSLKGWVFNSAKGINRAISIADSVFKSTSESDVQGIINNSDSKSAQVLVNSFNIPMPEGY